MREATPNAPARAHPRSRGENGLREALLNHLQGSSPLTRGKRGGAPATRVGDRLIPAHAGKTRRRTRILARCGAHPRSRGENADFAVPDLRGRWLIPAHAGKTPACQGQGWASRAHPRSRGENSVSGPPACAARGSSPLTRGKHFLTCAFIAQIDQILESLELCAFSESYSSQNVYATDAPRDRVRSIGLAPRSSRGAS